MLNKLFSKLLELKIRDQILKFSSLADFEFSMAGRTAISPEKISQLLTHSMEQLKEEEQAIKKAADSLFSILSNTIIEPTSIDRALRELDPLRFSQDHDWRDIIKGLNDSDEAFNPLRRVALAKYLQYLSSLQETIGYIRAAKDRPFETASEDHKEASRDFKATVAPEHIFPEPAPKPREEEQFERLPNGEAVAIKLTPGKRFDILLATHKCQLVAADDRILFIDQAGRKSILSKGRIFIGRGSNCTVKMDSGLREVSRVHLLIHNQGGDTLVLTDFSTHGTYVVGRFRETPPSEINNERK